LFSSFSLRFFLFAFASLFISSKTPAFAAFSGSRHCHYRACFRYFDSFSSVVRGDMPARYDEAAEMRAMHDVTASMFAPCVCQLPIAGTRCQRWPPSYIAAAAALPRHAVNAAPPAMPPLHAIA
jgi:hypothetical protein